jgi:S1-C subfamily serine protease
MIEDLLIDKKIGDRMKLTIYRDGTKMNIKPTIGATPVGFQGQVQGFWPETERPEPWGAVLQAQAVALTGALQGGEVGAGEIEVLGMELGELSPGLAMASGIPEVVRGLLVVESTAQAAAAGLSADDVIEAVNGQRVKTMDDFIKVMNQADLKRGISLDVYRQGQYIQLTMKG